MKKIFFLIKACMTDNMQLFKIKSRDNKKIKQVILPIILALFCMISVSGSAESFIQPLTKIHMEYVLLSLFVAGTFFVTLTQGIYKASGLLFNSKDDDLLFSLPIKKSTVLFVRVFKFYIFEFLFNSIFMLPAILVYIIHVKVEFSFYIASLFMLLLLPIFPIIISCIIGSIISKISSTFKLKNAVQTVITILLLLLIFYFSFNIERIISNLGEKASIINDVITKIYYPATSYVKMATQFRVKDLLLFIFINITLFIATIIILSNRYFKINSSTKGVKTSITNKDYIIKKRKPITSLIRKEFKRFVGTPVFITNAGFGLILFIIAVISMIFKFDDIVNSVDFKEFGFLGDIKSCLPIIVYGLICLTSFMTSITSSMISLEGKSFNILKSLPIKPHVIILSKVLMAVIVMIPILLIGNIILFIRFNFNIWEMLLIIISSILLPLISEMIGIIVNLKYPKMDAESDTEVVKQSMSSMISVFLGMFIAGFSIFGLICFLKLELSNYLILILFNLVYSILCFILLIWIKKKSVKLFNEING